jgi:hypothetical protein
LTLRAVRAPDRYRLLAARYRIEREIGDASASCIELPTSADTVSISPNLVRLW